MQPTIIIYQPFIYYFNALVQPSTISNLSIAFTSSRAI
jgi:hypothetical protein